MKASIGNSVDFSVNGARALTEEARIEVSNRTQAVVSQAQVKDLDNVMKVLDKVLSNRQRPYYIVIDQLDENWGEENLRYRLIKALFLTAREFIGVNNAKVVLAIRRDLIDRVFRLTRDSGFQEEKYRGSYLPLTWTKDNILKLLDLRVQHLVARRYTKQVVTFRDVLPPKYDGEDIGSAVYNYARRPRDVIALFNCCILASVDRQYVGSREFSVALGEYSRGRLRALADEWQADYPHLVEYATRILRGKPATFKSSLFTEEDLLELSWSVAVQFPDKRGFIHTAAHLVVEDDSQVGAFRDALVHGFYKVGLVGLKVVADAKASWADDDGQSVSRGEISDETSITVHPAYRRAVGIAGSDGDFAPDKSKGSGKAQGLTGSGGTPRVR